jgi:hypothetical protein
MIFRAGAQGQSLYSSPLELQAPRQKAGKLYSDEEIRKLILLHIDKDAPREKQVFHLKVVPPGHSYPRSKVFKTLGIEDARIGDFRWSERDSVVFLSWQVSPSFDIKCMTAANDPENAGLRMDHVKRKIYAVKIVERSK